MSMARFMVGDVFDRMAELDDGSIDLVLTSPPFLALRSYLPADHPDKGKGIGSEPTPAAFLDTLLALTAEWRRLLASHGSIAVELGDTYSGSGGAGGDYAEGGLRDGQQLFSGSAHKRARHGIGDDYRPARTGRGGSWPMDKSLCGIPHLYHLSLAYGRNLLTGELSPAGQWRVRNVVAWCRPNPPVGALGDKFRPATSYMTIATIARDRYFDLDAVRGPGSPNTHARTAKGVESRPTTGKAADDERRGGNFSTLDTLHSTVGAPPLDWWNIPTSPYAGSHYATWPPALCERPIKSMVPQRVCTTCGEPSRRITERGHVDAETGEPVDLPRADIYASDIPREIRGMQPRNGSHARVNSAPTTTGWTDCGHDSWRNGLVLDPFAGSGTTLAVATGHGRDAIGIDLDERNAHLAAERVGMFLEVDYPPAVVA